MAYNFDRVPNRRTLEWLNGLGIQKMYSLMGSGYGFSCAKTNFG